ncbi:unnamed protein product [Urochloa humidicola]
MDAKPLPAILVGMLLASLAFSAKCEGGRQERTTGGLQRRSPDGQETIDGDRLRIILCFRRSTPCPEFLHCFCCLTLPGCPCYEEQQECWDVCPVPPAHAATSPSASGRSGGGVEAEGRVIGKCS